MKRITVSGASVEVDGMSFHFSTWRAANEAMCKLREPTHTAPGGRTYFIGAPDRTAFEALKEQYEK